jgi:guanine deaminase
MARSIELAIDNVRQGRGGPFGAVVVAEGKIIAEGTNSVASANDPTAHAEVVAIREACLALGRFHLRGCELYTSCQPCPMCLAAIYWAHLDRIYFGGTAADASKAGFEDSFIYNEIAKPPSSRKIPMLQLMHTEALRPFRVWQQQPNKIPY